MDRVVCPHCKSHRMVATKVPREVVAVMPCPACNELAVLYRGKVIGINRRIIEQGSKIERTEHLAEVIAEFLEAGLPSFMTDHDEPGESSETEAAEHRPEPVMPISDQEFEKFVRIDLKCLDNGAYFKRHFGRK